MRVLLALTLVLAAHQHAAHAQFWKYSQQLFNPFAWIRQGKTTDTSTSSSSSSSSSSLSTSRAAVSSPSPTPSPIPLSYPATIMVASTTLPDAVKIESKMDEIDLGIITTKKAASQPTPQPSDRTTLNAKASRTTITTTLAERTTSKRHKNRTTTTAPHHAHSSYISPHPHRSSSHASPPTHHTKHTSPIWTTVPITTQQTATNKLKNATTFTSTTVFRTPSTYPSSPPSLPSSYSYPTSHFASSSSSSSASSSSSTSSVSVTPALTVSTTKTPSPLREDVDEDEDATTQEEPGTTEEPRENHRQHDFYLSKREKPQVKIATNISQNLLPLPAGASAALVKPTKYHYYPHNQHIYLLPECAIQQVCNAVYVRLNWTQPLCACPSRYRDPCSASLNSDDLHTTELQMDRSSKRALTLVKTCEPTSDMRVCRSPRDWSLLALQNIRTGKSHYLVICRCPDSSALEGPMSHDQPTYASVPGIRVYGMMCVSPPPPPSPTSAVTVTIGNKRRGRPLRLARAAATAEDPPFPWARAVAFAKDADWDE